MITTTIASSTRRVGQQLSSVVKNQSLQQGSSLAQRRSFVTIGASRNIVPEQSERNSTRGFASKKKSGGDDSSSISYFERKAATKQARVEAYKHKLERAIRIKSRRDNAPRDVKKNEFRSWWDGRKAYEEQMDRKARQAGMDWTVKVATITFSDFRDLEGVNGNYGGQAWVYRRGGEPCRSCGTPIQREKLSGRSTHWCPTCQS